MSIQDELRGELNDAMRHKDRRRINVIRQIESEVALVRSAPGFHGTVDDDVYRSTIESYAKKMDKARGEFEAAGERGQAQAETLAYEVEYLQRWMPQRLGEDETRLMVRQAIADLGANDPKAAGRVIGHVMGSSGDLDGGLVSRLVREELGIG